MARIVAVVALALLAGCGGDDPTDVRVTFFVTGSEVSESHEIACDPAGEGDAAICEEIAGNEDLDFPDDREECPLPVPSTYLTVTGTHGGDELDQQMTDCSEGEGRAVQAWTELLGFDSPPFERR